jgi:hypothetical protein
LGAVDGFWSGFVLLSKLGLGSPVATSRRLAIVLLGAVAVPGWGDLGASLRGLPT